MQLAAGELDISSTEIELFRHEQDYYPGDTLQQLLQKLSHRQQEVINLRFYHNFPYDTIASIMDMNYQSVLNLLQRALKTLRTKYNKLQPPL
jgi:RNA polymerase sigma factor (sigma-70 family)